MFVLLRIEDSKVVSDVYWEFDEEGAAAAGEDDVVALGVDDGAALGASELAAVTYEVAAAAGTVSVEVW